MPVAAETRISAILGDSWEINSTDGGGFSGYVAVNEGLCHALPETVPLSGAALIEPLTAARHAVRKSGFDDYREKTIFVLGGGPVGLAVIFVLKADGAGKIIVSGPRRERQKQTAECVNVVLNPREGLDIVFDCSGVMPGLRDGMNALQRGGTYVNVAGWETECVVPMQYFMRKEIIFRASMSYTAEDFKKTVDDDIAGKFRGFEKLVTARIALEDVVAKGFEELINRNDNHVKIMVTPERESWSRRDRSL